MMEDQMSMQALNQLVARSIIDPAIVQSFSSGRIAEVLADLEFSPELQSQLTSLNAETWTEFAVMAYRTVKAAMPVKTRIELPSPAEGLMTDETQAGKEQVA
jgi:hypothetical protein